MKVQVLAPVTGRIVRYINMNGTTVPAIVVEFSATAGSRLLSLNHYGAMVEEHVSYAPLNEYRRSTWHWPNEAVEEKSFFDYEAP